ncbi:MAG: protein-tyrosine phosphatase family protein [Anaerolineae bacterium]
MRKWLTSPARPTDEPPTVGLADRRVDAQTNKNVNKSPLPIFRLVSLPDHVRGRLYLHSMPGRFEPWQMTLDAARMKGISLVVSLTSLDEIESKSPTYARALQRNELPWQTRLFPIVDFGVPSDRAQFLEFVQFIAAELRKGTNILMHCAAGIGRTGTVASCVLVALGEPPAAAMETVRIAGSYAERPEQVALIEWVATQLALPGGQ